MDYLGILKSLVQNFLHKEIVRGASTITQQLVKNTLLYDILGDEAYEQTYSRKIKEILITMQVEQTFTKDEILQMYMNEIPLGGVNYGFQAAANAYFDKDVSELTLAESALIAGLIQSPGVYSPLYGTNPDLAEDRRTYVLDQMTKHTDLTGIGDEDIDAARAEELVYSSKKIDITAPHFVFYVKQLLEEEFGVDRVERGGLKVTTTLDSSLQDIAEEEVTNAVTNATKYNANNGAMVVLNPKNGQILAMVGSVDYWNTDDPRVDGNVNITISDRQMGSSVKPFVYLNAISKGYGPWLIAPDLDEISFGTYDPVNWDGKNLGLMTARKALVLSRNVPAVYTLQLGGIDGYVQLMEKLGVTGISSKADYGLSLALGSAEMKLLEFTNAYATLANSGIKNNIVSILKVEDSDGTVLKEVTESEGTRVIDEKEAYLVNWMICDMQSFQDRTENAYFYINGKKLCGKTGTSNGPKDLVAFLYNQSLVVGAWNGNNNNEDMPNAWASTVSLKMANSFFKRVINNYSEFSYSRPAGVLTTSVCLDTGATPADGVECQKESTIYISGQGPQTDNRKAIEVCAENGLVPDNLEAARKYGLTVTKTLLSTKLENTQQIDAYKKYLTGLEGSKYLFDTPATGSCTLPLGTDNAPVIEVYSPSASQQVVRGKNLEISGTVRYLESISEFKVQFDGSNISDASLNADGTFVVNYFVPSDTVVADHTITVYVKDNYGKTNTQNVTVKVIDSSSLISLSIASPSNGGTISSFPTTLVASVTGGTVDQVTFSITKVGGTNTEISDTDGNSGGWSVSWPSSSGAGQYTISVKAKSGSTIISGNTITVTVN